MLLGKEGRKIATLVSDSVHAMQSNSVGLHARESGMVCGSKRKISSLWMSCGGLELRSRKKVWTRPKV